MSSAQPSKPDRLAEFLRRLSTAEPVRSWAEAYKLIQTTLDNVEDQLTDIPFNPDRWRSDGRMYAPLPDSIRTVPGSPGVRRYRSVAHHTFLGASGSIEIRSGSAWESATVIFQKRGQDGLEVWDPQPDRSDASGAHTERE